MLQVVSGNLCSAWDNQTKLAKAGRLTGERLPERASAIPSFCFCFSFNFVTCRQIACLNGTEQLSSCAQVATHTGWVNRNMLRIGHQVHESSPV